MMTKNLSKNLMAASLVVALGVVGVAPAMATGAAMQNDTDTSISTKVSDAWITTKVKSEFATTKGVSATDTSVETKDGVVMLSGTVDSQAEKRMAIKSAQSVKGVKAVQADKLMVHHDGDSRLDEARFDEQRQRRQYVVGHQSRDQDLRHLDHHQGENRFRHYQGR